MIIDCSCPSEVLKKRLQSREFQAKNESDATPALVELLLSLEDPLSVEEQRLTLTVPTDNTVNIEVLMRNDIFWPEHGHSSF